MMKSTCRLECADSEFPVSVVIELLLPLLGCPEKEAEEATVPTEKTSMNTSTPSVIFDLLREIITRKS